MYLLLTLPSVWRKRESIQFIAYNYPQEVIGFFFYLNQGTVMKIIRLCSSAVEPNCSRINWCYHHERFPNDIQKLISRYDVTKLICSPHDYMFNLTPSGEYVTQPFSFDETNMLMHLMPDESDYFYLKAALREFMNAFIVFNSKGDRVYPEDII